MSRTSIPISTELAEQLENLVDRRVLVSAYATENIADANFMLAEFMYHAAQFFECSLRSILAIHYYSTIIKMVPDFIKPHLSLGYMFLKNGKLDQALKCFQKAQRINKFNGSACYGKGYALLRLGKLEQADKEFQQVQACKPSPELDDIVQKSREKRILIAQLRHLDIASAKQIAEECFVNEYAERSSKTDTVNLHFDSPVDIKQHKKILELENSQPVWHREGNYYLSADIKQVTYKNAAHSSLIKSISVVEEYILIYFEHPIFNVISKLWHNMLGRDHVCDFIQLNAIALYLTSTSQRYYLLKLLENFNCYCTHEEFDKDLLQELKEIINFISKDEAEVELPVHHIPERIIASVNPSYRGMSLVKWLKEHPDATASVSEFRQLLIDGADPTQTDELGYSPCLLALFHPNRFEFFQLLLFYNVNPFVKCNAPMPVSAMEVARIRDSQCFNHLCLVKATSKTKFTTIYFNEVSCHAKPGEIITEFYKNDQIHIITRMLAVKQLTRAEEGIVFRLFTVGFPIVNEQDHKQIFEQDFFGGNKYIHLIYNQQQKIVGFNLCQLMELPHYPDRIIWYCIYSVILPELQGTGLLRLLSFRVAYALQQYFLQKKVGVFLVQQH